MEEVQKRWICGFWRRIGALFIDSLILGLLGYILGLFFGDIFVQIGNWGRLFGFVTSISYFGVMNSSYANGQTIGKKILNIRVVDLSNSTINLPKSLLRYSFIGVPFSLNGIQITHEALLSYLVYPLSFTIFGGLISISYLYIFNRVTRQSLHDLVVGTYVVNTKLKSEGVPAIWKPHLVVVAGLFIAAALVPIFTTNIEKSELFKGLLATREALSNNKSVIYAGVTESLAADSASDDQTITYVNAQAFLYKNNIEDSDLARQLAQTIIDTYPESLNKKFILVTLTHGYDIGISSAWNSHSYQFNPQELRDSE